MVGYTTTLKIMQIMSEKGLLERKEDGRKHIYSAAFQEHEIRNLLLGKFLDSAFEGSAMKLVMQALGNHRASPKELEELKALIEKLENEQK
jgi:predicted transcriptional regulator